MTNLQQHKPEEGKVGTSRLIAQGGKSPEQGAATTDGQVGKPWEEKNGRYRPGYASWAYDEEKQRKLRKTSLDLVGLKDAAPSATL